MELRFNKRVGDVEQSMTVTFDAKSREDCVQAAFHSDSFFGPKKVIHCADCGYYEKGRCRNDAMNTSEATLLCVEPYWYCSNGVEIDGHP